MDIFPQLYTTRLILRKIQIEDIDALVKYADNKKISDRVLNIPYPYREPDAVFRISYVVQGFKNKSRFVFSIVLKETQEFIGEISLHLGQNMKIAQMGYWVGEPFWNKGVATEAIEAVLNFGFQKLNLEQVFATCHEDNQGSIKALLKNGMVVVDDSGSIIQVALEREAWEKRRSV
jgi:ribosomal-protein-alanine N-acetyltransferase